MQHMYICMYAHICICMYVLIVCVCGCVSIIDLLLILLFSTFISFSVKFVFLFYKHVGSVFKEHDSNFLFDMQLQIFYWQR